MPAKVFESAVQRYRCRRIYSRTDPIGSNVPKTRSSSPADHLVGYRPEDRSEVLARRLGRTSRGTKDYYEPRWKRSWPILPTTPREGREHRRECESRPASCHARKQPPQDGHTRGE